MPINENTKHNTLRSSNCFHHNNRCNNSRGYDGKYNQRMNGPVTFQRICRPIDVNFGLRAGPKSAPEDQPKDKN